MFQEMRNAIIHSGGQLIKEHVNVEAIRRYQQQNSDFEITEKNYLVLSEDFLRRVVLVSDLFTTFLFAEIKKRVPKV
jgi:hypothetical protein